MQTTLDENYWNDKWKTQQTGWDVGYASPAIMKYMDQYPNKNAAILIPGCGNGYEAEQLSKNGYTNIALIDFAPEAAKILKVKFASINAIKVFCEDYFEHVGQYDLIIEQTFFCAIMPKRRMEYATKSASLLHKNGKLIGLLFDRLFEQQGPPFGGSMNEYYAVFEDQFLIKTMEKCYKSITPRENVELFINLIKK